MKIKKIEIAEKEMEFDLFPSLLSVNDFKEYKTNISVRPDKNWWLRDAVPDKEYKKYLEENHQYKWEFYRKQQVYFTDGYRISMSDVEDLYDYGIGIRPALYFNCPGLSVHDRFLFNGYLFEVIGKGIALCDTVKYEGAPFNAYPYDGDYSLIPKPNKYEDSNAEALVHLMLFKEQEEEKLQIVNKPCCR